MLWRNLLFQAVLFKMRFLITKIRANNLQITLRVWNISKYNNT